MTCISCNTWNLFHCKRKFSKEVWQKVKRYHYTTDALAIVLLTGGTCTR